MRNGRRKYEYGVGRYETKFTYTYEDISRLTGLKKSTLSNYVYKGKLDPADIGQVIALIERRRRKCE